MGGLIFALFVGAVITFGCLWLKATFPNFAHVLGVICFFVGAICLLAFLALIVAIVMMAL
jgi:hypothetical protein